MRRVAVNRAATDPLSFNIWATWLGKDGSTPDAAQPSLNAVCGVDFSNFFRKPCLPRMWEEAKASCRDRMAERVDAQYHHRPSGFLPGGGGPWGLAVDTDPTNTT